ncbi:MAG: Hsp20/alpha crystallin family protein [Pseudomonadota bacterium]
MIVKWTPRQLSNRAPWREIERLRNQLEGVFDTLSQGVDAIRHGAGVFPLVNLFEDDQNLYLTAETPGLTVSDLKLSLQGDSLTLRGEVKPPESNREVNYHRREREAGFFRRVINLPEKTAPDKVTASLKNGVLTIVLPKTEEAKVRRIDIQNS